MKNSLLSPILLTALVTATLVGTGFYFWCNRPQQPLALTREYLANSEWGPEYDYGGIIKFHDDGTFDEHCACETGDARPSGRYEIQGNKVTIITEKYDGLSFEEAKKSNSVGQLPDVLRPPLTMSLEKTDASLQFTEYFAKDGRIQYWNKTSKIPEESTREHQDFVLLTTLKNLKPKANARILPHPYANMPQYSICEAGYNGCEQGKFYPLSEIYEKTLARTQFKETVNGIEEYWYLAKIFVPMYSEVRLTSPNNPQGGTTSNDPAFAWIHGSELE